MPSIGHPEPDPAELVHVAAELQKDYSPTQWSYCPAAGQVIIVLL